MKTVTKAQSIPFLPLLILAMLTNILAQVTHETGHLLFFQLTGREATWVFTKVAQMSEPPINPAEWTEITNPDGSSNWTKVSSMPPIGTERAMMAVAGPLLGLLGAVLGLVMFRQSTSVTSKQAWLAYTLSVSLAAVLYYLRAPTRIGGDEYDVAINLGIAKALIEIPFALGYLACLLMGLHELETWKIRLTWLGTILLGAIATAVPMVLLDPILIAQIDAGNVWVQPVFGYSLPVFITIILAVLGVWKWARWQESPSK